MHQVENEILCSNFAGLKTKNFAGLNRGGKQRAHGLSARVSHALV